MNKLTITQKGYHLETDGNIIPAQFSADIQIRFIKDESYKDYIVSPSIKYGDTIRILTYDNGIITLPRQAFKQEGHIYLAFLLKSTTSTEEVNTNPIELCVNESIGGIDILPPDQQTWLAEVKDAVDQIMDVEYMSIINGLLETNKQLNLDTIELQRVLNGTVNILNQKLANNEFVPKHKFENGKLFFSNPDGTWDSGYTLAGQTSITIDGVVQQNLTMSSTRTPIASKKKVQVTNADGAVLLETSADNIRYIKADGTDKIDGKTLIDLMATLISNTSFYDINPKPMLTELKGYVDITQIGSINAKKFDRNGTETTLLKSTDIAKAIVEGFSTVAELEGLLRKYEGYSLNTFNKAAITIGDKTIGAWHRFFFPYATVNDGFGIITYPDASRLYILGRAPTGFSIKQVY